MCSVLGMYVAPVPSINRESVLRLTCAMLTCTMGQQLGHSAAAPHEIEPYMIKS